MSLQAIKESKLSAAICRLSPPNSPSRSRTVHSTSVPPPKSRILAKLDELDILSSAGNVPPRHPVKSKLVQPPNLHHPFSLAALPSEMRTISTTVVDANMGAENSIRAAISERRTARKTAKAKSTHLTDIDDSVIPHELVSGRKTTSKPKKQKEALPSSITTSTNALTRAPSVLSVETDTIATSDSPNHQIAEQPSARQTDAVLLYSYKDYSPCPAVVYTRDEEEANDLVQALKGPLGFDLEWQVFFRRGESRKARRTALVQLCDTRMILLIQISAMKKFPQKLKEVIESTTIVKMGANINGDGRKLFRDYGILAANLVELGALAQEADPTFNAVYKRSIVSLEKMTQMYTGKGLDKGAVRTSNWEAVPLTATQQTYAANDAHVALTVYKRLVAIAAEQKRSLNPAKYTTRITGDEATVTTVAPAAPSSTVRSTSFSTSSSSARGSLPVWARPLRYATSMNEATIPRPQEMRAYNLWHKDEMPLKDICAALRSKENPLAESTVISYVVKALQADRTLPFSMERLVEFVQLEAGSWTRHREWIMTRRQTQSSK